MVLDEVTRQLNLQSQYAAAFISTMNKGIASPSGSRTPSAKIPGLWRHS